MTGSINEETRRWLPPCQLSLLNGCLEDPGGMETRVLEMSQCDVFIKKPHSETHAVKKSLGFLHEKRAHQECDLQLSWWYLHQDTTQNQCSNARQEHLRKIMSNKVSEATSLKDHGGVRFITRPYRANISMFITGTCSQRRSKNKDNIKNTDLHCYRKDTWRDTSISTTIGF